MDPMYQARLKRELREALKSDMTRSVLGPEWVARSVELLGGRMWVGAATTTDGVPLHVIYPPEEP